MLIQLKTLEDTSTLLIIIYDIFQFVPDNMAQGMLDSVTSDGIIVCQKENAQTPFFYKKCASIVREEPGDIDNMFTVYDLFMSTSGVTYVQVDIMHMLTNNHMYDMQHVICNIQTTIAHMSPNVISCHRYRS
jgi:hypothetical protein